MRKVLLGFACAACLLESPTAHAQRAEYVGPESLPGEGLPHLADVALLGEYARFADQQKVDGLSNVGDFALRSRFLLGRAIDYCAGLDGSIGGSNRGFVYGATAYLAGLGTRWGSGNAIALCGGAGLDAFGSAVPRAWEFPAELSIALDLGPIRPVLWARPEWIAGREARKKGATLSFMDELETGLLVRLSRQHRYWARMSAGGGLAIGVSYREIMGTHAFVGSLGFDFVGEQ